MFPLCAVGVSLHNVLSFTAPVESGGSAEKTILMPNQFWTCIATNTERWELSNHALCTRLPTNRHGLALIYEVWFVCATHEVFEPPSVSAWHYITLPTAIFRLNCHRHSRCWVWHETWVKTKCRAAQDGFGEQGLRAHVCRGRRQASPGKRAGQSSRAV